MAATETQSAGSAASTASAQSRSRSVIAASACGRWKTITRPGSCSASSTALSSRGLYSMTRLPSMPQDALTIAEGRASSIRTASSRAANPPKTTLWTAPIRAQASIATAASGIIGM